MSASSTDLSSSISSSGQVDGLGRRSLAFDRETGAMLERLYLRPELGAFEGALRDRVEQLARFENERFARPLAVERDPWDGELTVLSEFVSGSRLSDLLETAHESAHVPGVDVAIGYLLETLPALSTFHSATGSAHGLIDPARTVITATGQVVFLDSSFGPAVERLGLARTRLWSELGIAAPPSAGVVRLDVSGDISQVALSALMLVLGRPLRANEYPDALPALLMEVVEVAQIRGSAAFASGIQRLLQRSLPMPGRRAFATAEEALNEVRLLVGREIGVEVCHHALVDFVEQMDAASLSTDDPGIAFGSLDTLDLLDPEELAGSIELVDVDDGESAELVDASFDDEDEDESLEMEISLDDVAAGAGFEARPVLPDAVDEWRVTEARAATAPPADAPPGEPAVRARVEQPQEWTEPSGVQAEGAPAESAEQAAETAESSSSRRRKRQQRSARARKDKLRSTAAAQHVAGHAKPAPAPPAPAPPPRPPTGWLVSPDRAAAFDPPVPDARPASPPPPVPTPAATAPAPPVPVPPIAPVAPAVPPPMPVYANPAPAAPTIAPVQPFPVQQRPITVAPTASSGPLKIKAEPPSGYTPPRKRVEPTPAAISANPYTQRAPMFGQVAEAQSRPFPWKLAAAALIIVAVAVVVGRAYLPSRSVQEEQEPAPQTAQQEAPAAAAPAAAGSDVVIETQPAGARVLLDGKLVGESPLKLTSVAPGRHVLTFVTSSGESKRTVRVTAGKTLTLDVPLYSGWVAIFAPIVLEVAENGRTIGTTEQNRLMLPPGSHKLTLTSRELGYSVVKDVEVQAGEVYSVTLDPRGQANFNAVPWAEVWFDGKKIGDTPIANREVPIGIREFVFKHPELGERKVTSTIYGDRQAAISVDMTKPQ